MRRMKVIAYKRKRKKLTDYRKRINLIASNMPRLVVRKSLNNISAQLIKFDIKGDKVVMAAHSEELKKLRWKHHRGNLPSAYLTGLLLGHKAISNNIKKAILDIGLSHSVPGSSQYALLKGALDAGMDIPHSQEVLPDELRIQGSHIAAYKKHPSILNDFQIIKTKIAKGKEHANKAD